MGFNKCMKEQYGNIKIKQYICNTKLVYFNITAELITKNLVKVFKEFRYI